MGGPEIFGVLLGPYPISVGHKSCFWQCYLLHNQSCVPNLKLLASAVVQISRGSQNFGVLHWPRTPAILVLKVVFWQHYSMTPSYIPNLKSLAKIVAEIRGPKIFGVHPSPDPANFGSKSCFGMPLTEHKLYNKF